MKDVLWKTRDGLLQTEDIFWKTEDGPLKTVNNSK